MQNTKKGPGMRLICPKCGAQYEIADSVIPPEGREVECSNCTHIWFQLRKQPEGVPSRELAQSTLSILREEAAREMAERQRERITGGLPDAQALASTLEPMPEPRVIRRGPDPEPEPLHESGAGYASGFAAAVVVGMVLLSAYLMASLIVRGGGGSPWLAEALLTVDGWRIWLYDHTVSLLLGRAA